MASDGAALGIIFDNLGKTSKYPNISKLLLFSKGAFADAKAVLTETTKKKVCEDAGIQLKIDLAAPKGGMINPEGVSFFPLS